MARIALPLLALLAFASPAAAQNENKWGAIAFGGRDQAWGTAVDYPSADAARTAALASCGGTCSQTFAFLRSCAAVAESPGGGVGVSANRWRGRAISFAMVRCGRTGSECAVLAVACTTH